MINKNVKIAKVANNQSLMDASPNLWFHRDKDKNNEEVYKGSVAFAITEVKNNRYGKAYLDKATSKLVMKSIIDRTFFGIFGEEGFKQFGGTKSGENGCRSRLFKIKVGKNKKNEPQYIFSIEEGPGKVTNTGAIAPAGKPDSNVSTYIHHIDAMKFAHEIYDYIRDVELVAQQEGKPLHTITYHSHGNSQQEGMAMTFDGKKIADLENAELTRIYNQLLNEPLEKRRLQAVIDEVRRRKEMSQ